MKPFVMLAVALGALAVAMPAAAQAQDNANDLASARCVVDSVPRDVRKLLGTLPGSPEERKALDRVAPAYISCAEGAEKMGGRPVLALAAAEGRLGSAKMPAPGAAPWYASALAGRTAGADYDATGIATQEIGACVVRAAPAAAAGLIRSPLGSAAERTAIEGLKPAIGPCVPQGTPVRLSPWALRLMLAEPVYHAISG